MSTAQWILIVVAFVIAIWATAMLTKMRITLQEACYKLTDGHQRMNRHETRLDNHEKRIVRVEGDSPHRGGGPLCSN